MNKYLSKLFPFLLFFLWFSNEAKCQTIPTRGQIYDYDVGDEFHYTDIEKTPNATRMTISTKYFSILNDTVFYGRHFDNYKTEYDWNPSPHYDYTFWTTDDTTYYTNLDTLISAQYSYWVIFDSLWDYRKDTVFYSSEFCGKSIYEFNGCSHCSFEGNHLNEKYGIGLGFVLHNHQVNVWPQTNEYFNLIYYRKGTDSCGEPDTTNSAMFLSIAESRTTKSNISVYPNPASSSVYVLTPENSAIEIIDIKGQIIEKYNTTGSKTFINLISYQPGIYIIKIIADEVTIIKKLIKN